MKLNSIFKIALLPLVALFFTNCHAQESDVEFGYGAKPRLLENKKITPGAYDFDNYLPKLNGKRIAILGNQTSEVNGTLLPDTLISLGVNVVKLFSPEHGFRGDADAGAKVKSGIDSKTGLPIVSLYGNNKKMTAAQLSDVDIVIYDLQDVGVRFYTYISTLEYTMEACAENGKTLMILDRPNPLGNIVDGPVLENGFTSFVGMQKIPIIYGMTPAEYAQMLVGEKWISNATALKLDIIPNKNYDHNSIYELPISPSPNLKNMTAIYLYPSLCLFEGTDVSVGRGTATPFQQFGSPNLRNYSYSFIPKSMKGATSPMFMGKKCYGKMIATTPKEARKETQDLFQIRWLIDAYKNHTNKSKFFNSNNFFNKLAGNATLKQQIIAGKSASQIRQSWQPALDNFKKIRKQYLLYKDFE